MIQGSADLYWSGVGHVDANEEKLLFLQRLYINELALLSVGNSDSMITLHQITRLSAAVDELASVYSKV